MIKIFAITMGRNNETKGGLCEYPGCEAVIANGQNFQAGPGMPRVTYGDGEARTGSAGEPPGGNVRCR
ncbi:MAG: hypothetical protein RDV48_15700 [Candidatus Eremiobacteraeota bacterium]|nr:hypothetical protein [Candidatus Eremiobacteraeota bacterium]